MAKKVYKEKKTVKAFSAETSKTKKIIGIIVASVLATALVVGLCILAINEAKKETPAPSAPTSDKVSSSVDDDDNWTNNY